jgi:protein-tyrosine phosphatase
MHYHILTENQRKFITSSMPLENEINEFINILQQNSINLVINLTETSSYNKEKIKNANIDYLHFPIQDGTCPTDEQIKKLITFLDRYNSIAFHCTAGFGRAPLLLAISLIILYDYKPVDIIEKIRNLNQRAFNTTQIEYLYNFKRKKYISGKCIIS